jgi:hypothetical protein
LTQRCGREGERLETLLTFIEMPLRIIHDVGVSRRSAPPASAGAAPMPMSIAVHM